jgi:phosphoadenosine phosphosulfate reductase
MRSLLRDDEAARFEGLYGKDLIRALISAYPGKVAATSSFGAEAAVLLDLVAQVDPSIPVLTVDTGCLFDETKEYRNRLVRHLGLLDVRIITPEPRQLTSRDPDNSLWWTDADACCQVRKVEPMAWASRDFKVLIDGRKRFHGKDRSDLSAVIVWGVKLKAAPLADYSEDDIERAFEERKLPRHPLVAAGYRSIGCEPCTSPVALGEPVRSGRWAGKAKTECGLHKSPWL